jgi:hypothetical protein
MKYSELNGLVASNPRGSYISVTKLQDLQVLKRGVVKTNFWSF